MRPCNGNRANRLASLKHRNGHNAPEIHRLRSVPVAVVEIGLDIGNLLNGAFERSRELPHWLVREE